jgi:hypothetical protein
MPPRLALELEARWSSFLERRPVRRVRVVLLLHRKAVLAVALLLGITFMVVHWW